MSKARTPEGWTDVTRLDLIHSALFLAVYGFYGYQVCPYLETLALWQLMAPAVFALGVKTAIAHMLRPRLAAAPVEVAVKRLFWWDLGLFAGCGLALATFNLIVFGFPPDSGVKVALAFIAVGLYVALDLTFEREIRLADKLREEGGAFPLGARFLPYQSKFVLFSMINILVVSLVVTLVVLKDLIWVTETEIDPIRAQIVIMIELVFILAVMGAYLYRVIRQYARKTDTALREERDALLRVAAGDLSRRVTVSSNDEFGQIANLTNGMIDRLCAALEEVERTRDVTVKALVSLSAQRDNETGLHLLRTQIYVEILGWELARLPQHQGVVDEEFIRRLRAASTLHDIGKVGVPDAVLTKPGRLSEDEFAVMKQHAPIGARALADACDALEGESPFLTMAYNIALSHHERWDGAGYPQGLAREAIPLEARIMAVADVYDALRARRVYKAPMTHEEAVAVIVEGRGSHFDPELVDAFLRVEDRFALVARQHDDAARPEADVA